MGPLLPFSVPPVSQNSRVAFVKDFYALGGGDSPLFLEEKDLCCYNNLAVARRQICFLKSFKEN